MLEYEKNKDKLFGLMKIPFLTRVFQAEAEKIPIPETIPTSVVNADNRDYAPEYHKDVSDTVTFTDNIKNDRGEYSARGKSRTEF